MAKLLISYGSTIYVFFKLIIKENGKLVQLLERDQNLKSKNEIDQSYLKSLRYTVYIILTNLIINLFSTFFN